MSSGERPRVLITGGSGRIGRLIVKNLAEQYDFTLLDRRQPPASIRLPFVRADISQLDAIREHFYGVDTVIHLAADPDPHASWDSLLPNNIIGLYNVFQAADEAGCRRIIFSSSVWAVLGYPSHMQVYAEMPVRPPSLYGATKAWAEALANFYAHTRNISVICIRIGWLASNRSPHLRPDQPNLDLIVTPGDLTHLINCCLEAADDVKFGIFHGLSNNLKKRFDIEEARRVLNYQPQDDAFTLARHNYSSICRRWLGKVRRSIHKICLQNEKG